MYDMYPWHRADASNDDTARANGGPPRGNGTASPGHTPSARPGHAPSVRPGHPAKTRAGRTAAGAVQVALDRRDNGGDPGQPRDE